MINKLVGYSINRSLSTMSISEKREVVRYCLGYCENEFGRSKYVKDDIRVSIRKSFYKDIYYGQYCPWSNRMILFYNCIPTLGEFVRTIIHEYTHYCQPIIKKYYKLSERYDYWNHPYEIAARENEVKYLRNAMKYIRGEIKKKVK